MVCCRVRICGRLGKSKSPWSTRNPGPYCGPAPPSRPRPRTSHPARTLLRSALRSFRQWSCAKKAGWIRGDGRFRTMAGRHARLTALRTFGPRGSVCSRRSICVEDRAACCHDSRKVRAAHPGTNLIEVKIAPGLRISFIRIVSSARLCPPRDRGEDRQRGSERHPRLRASGRALFTGGLTIGPADDGS